MRRHERIAPSRDFAERQDVVVGAPFLRNRIVAPVVEVEYDWTWLWRVSGKMHKPVDVRTSLVPAEPDAAAPPTEVEQLWRELLFALFVAFASSVHYTSIEGSAIPSA